MFQVETESIQKNKRGNSYCVDNYKSSISHFKNVFKISDCIKKRGQGPGARIEFQVHTCALPRLDP